MGSLRLNKNTLYWICQGIGWSGLTLVNVIFLSVSNSLNVNTMLYQVCIMVFGILATNYYREIIIRWNWLSLSIGHIIPRVLLSSLILSILTHFFTVLVFFLLRYDSIMDNPTISPDDGVNYTLYLSLFNVTFVCFFWSVIYFAYHFVENRNKTLKWEATINEFELNRLKSQLNPHFIFNALNSVRALVDENPPKAKQAITQLSNILRNSLSMDKKKFIRLEEELKTVEDYLALECIRFEERLKVHYKIHPETIKYEVPPMMVQTLVENGIKHGISKLTEGGEITIESELVNGELVIRISNSGLLDMRKSSTDSGYGLSNTKQRLQLLYNNLASFDISNVGKNTVKTEIKIPILT